VVAAFVLGLACAPVFSQGSLTPPGAPMPTMKTLAQIEPRTPIASIPITISNAGSYYLTMSLTGAVGQSGITIATNHVAIDLNGFELIGVPGSSNGIVESGARTNLTVANGTIRNWAGAALGAGAVYRGRFERLQLLDNDGAGLNTSDGTTIAGCTVQRSPAAGAATPAIAAGAFSVVRDCVVVASGQIGIRTGTGAVIDRCTAQSGASHGIEVGSGSVVSHCASLSNGGAGFNILGDGSLEHCTARSNSTNGFNLGNNSTLAHCVAVTNTGSGFVLGHGGALVSCTARSNTRDGIAGGTGNLVSQCVVTLNRTNGVNLDFGSRINGCTVTSNLADGIRVTGRCLVTGNNCDGNGTTGAHGGIHATFSDNRIEDNNLTGNNRGLLVDGNLNLIVRNKATFNAVNFSIAGGNATGPITSNAATNAPWANFDF